MNLSAENLYFSINNNSLVENINLSVGEHELVALIGPNGAGKSTVLNLLSGHLKPSSGKVLLKNKDLSKYSDRELSSHRSVMPQSNLFTFPIRCWELLSLARMSFNEPIGLTNEIVYRSLQLVNCMKLANREVTTLSGGERQRILIAKALAQIDNDLESIKETKFLLLDEPTSALDLYQATNVMTILKEVSLKLNIGIIMINHDLIAVQKFCKTCYLMSAGKILFSGSTKNILNAENISSAYRISASVAKDFVLTSE